MTATLAMPKTHSCRITCNRDDVRITSPSKATAVIDLTKWDDMTAAQQTVLVGIQDGSIESRSFYLDLTTDEMKIIAGMVDKFARLIPYEPEPKKEEVKPAPVAAEVTIRQTTTNQAFAHTMNGIVRGNRGLIDRIEKLKSGVDKLTGKVFSKLEYDIPTVKNDVCPNPSGWLWHYAFRTSNSCWCISDDQLKNPKIVATLELWRANGVKVRLIRYHPDEINTIREMVREELRLELVKAHTSLIENIAAASDRLTAHGPYSEKQEDMMNNRVRQIIREAGESLDAAIDCATAYDDSENIADLLEGLRLAILSQQLEFNARMQNLNKPERLFVSVV